MSIRLPTILAHYECQRSMACCQVPWKATLRPDELIELEQAATPAAALLRTAVHTRLGTPMLSQPQGVCSLLDTQARSCRVQQLGGLAALPAACRNFPRSVVDTPAGREIAFSLCCPTAATMVATGAIPFSWADLTQPHPVSTHPYPVSNYPASRQVGDRLPASRAADWSMAEVQEWRQGWWRRLDDPQQPLVYWLIDALRTPLDPRAQTGSRSIQPAEIKSVCAPWTPQQVQAVTEGLGRLRDSGPEHRARMRSHWLHWMSEGQWSTMQQAGDLHRAVASCCAGLWLQHAAVHDGLSLGESLTKTAKQVAQLLRLLVIFEALGGQHWQRDAVVAASHWGRIG